MNDLIGTLIGGLAGSASLSIQAVCGIGAAHDCELGHAAEAQSAVSRCRAAAVPAAITAAWSRSGSESICSAIPSASANRKPTTASASKRSAMHALALLGPKDLGDVVAGAVEELADLALDLGVAAARR